MNLKHNDAKKARRTRPLWFLPCFIFCAISLPAQTPNKPQAAKLEIVCSIYPIHDLTQNVIKGIPGVEAVCLVNPSVGCPHELSLTPANVRRLKEARVVLINGLGLDDEFLNPRFLPASTCSILKVSEAIPKEELIAEKDAPPGRLYGEGISRDTRFNPHVWVSPFLAARMARKIGSFLAENDPPNAPRYLANAEEYSARLEKIGGEMKRIVANFPTIRIVTMHDSFYYLARDLGMEVIGTILDENGREPSPRKLADLLTQLKKSPPDFIVIEPEFSDRLARVVAQETGRPMIALDPGSTTVGSSEGYEAAQRKNASALERLLSPH